jgi:hypothetical protein
MSSLKAAALTILVVGLGPSTAAFGGDDPLAKLIGAKPGNSICFSRAYDTAHLNKHPGQATASVVLSLRYDAETQPTIRIALKQKGKPVRYVVGGCSWSQEVNRDIAGKRLIKAFTKQTGYQCMAITQRGSAEEGGDFPLDLQADGITLTLYFDDAIAAFSGTDTDRPAGQLKLGREDRIFRLTRADPAECRGMEQRLVEP